MFTKGIRPEKHSIKSGQKFGKLTIVSYTDRVDRRGEYKCICDCGNITYASTRALKEGRHKSCGCLNKEPRPHLRLPDNMAIKKALLNSYKSSAVRREHVFTLSLVDFVNIIEQNCYYCGEIPSNSANVRHIKNYNSYKYNGVDRMDNKQGYTLNNCVPCCPHCNMSKRQLSIEEFKSWIERVYNNIFQKPSTTIPQGSTPK